MSVTYLLERGLLSAVGKGDSQVIKKTYTHVHVTSETSYIFFDLNLFCCPCDFLTPSIRWLPSSSTCLLHSTQKKSNFDQDHLFRAILTFSVNRYITYINISFILWILYPEVHSGRVMHYTFTATSLRIHSTHMASRKYHEEIAEIVRRLLYSWTVLNWSLTATVGMICIKRTWPFFFKIKMLRNLNSCIFLA